MLELFLIRHAKSSWKDLALDDFDRPLNKRGKASALFMGDLLRHKAIQPDIILSSPALRAESTSKSIAKALNKPKLVFHNDIYDASKQDLINLLKTMEIQHQTIFLIGHNPSLNALAYELVEFNHNIPTCGIVHIKLNCNSWNHIDASVAKLRDFEFPKKYNDFFDYF